MTDDELLERARACLANKSRSYVEDSKLFAEELVKRIELTRVVGAIECVLCSQKATNIESERCCSTRNERRYLCARHACAECIALLF